MTATTETLDQQIQNLQREIADKTKALAALRLTRPPEAVEDYTLQDASGAVSLASLFGDKQDLIVIHNMGRSCPYCTLWADGFNGVRGHLEDRAALVLCSPDTPEVQAEFAASRSWGFRMVSNGDSSFTPDMGFRFEKDGKTYQSPGYSTFRKQDDGSITRIGSDMFGPGDVYCGVWHMLDLLDGGPGDWGPKFSY